MNFKHLRSKMTIDKFCGCAKVETGGLVVGLGGILTNALLIYIIFPIVLEQYQSDVFGYNDYRSHLTLLLLIYCFVNVITSIVLTIGTKMVII